jgi:hypothetical protein
VESTFFADLIASGNVLDMTIGMVLGMVASPLMMKGIKKIRQQRKVERLIKEAAKIRQSGDIKDLSHK